MNIFQSQIKCHMVGQMISGKRIRLLLLLLLPLSIAYSATGNDAAVISMFDKPDSSQGWFSVNDGVMGGVSKGGFELTERKTLLFKGDLSLENNGGFASIRTTPSDLNLTGAKGISVKARGDGRTYWVGLHTAGQFSASSYRAYLPTTAGELTETFIPIADFKLQAFGRQLPGGPVDPAAIAAVGFTIADKKAGSFALEIESVKAVFEDTKFADSRVRIGSATLVQADIQASNGIIHVIDAVLLPPESSVQPMTPAELIALAIERGVPLFNSGNTGACSAVYEVTCEALCSLPGVSEDFRNDLAGALAKMRAAKTDREKAWILRHALDRVTFE